jgi:hypothetical protein
MSLFLVLFIAAHAIGQGQLFGFYIRNFPKSPKSIRRVFGDTTHWVLAAIIPSNPMLFSTVGPGAVFLFLQ